MKQFVLIDTSLADIHGPRYEYARRVLKAAASIGYLPHLAVNHQCAHHELDGVRVHAVYQVGFPDYAQPTPSTLPPCGIPQRLRSGLFAAKLVLLLSVCGQIWAHRHDSIDLLRRARCGPIRDRLRLVAAFFLLWGWEAVCDSGRVLRAIFPCRSYLQQVRAEARQAALHALRPAILALRRRTTVARWLFGDRATNCFAADTRRLLERLSLGPDDVVLIPAIESNEMQGLRLLFERLPAARLPTWHLLFRRNIYPGRDPDYGAADEHLRGLRTTFHRFRDRLRGTRVFFYTDSDQLTVQYNRLGAVSFKTLPIPVDPAFHGVGAAVAEDGALSIIYAGGARPEKGYHFLPRVVQDLGNDCAATGQAKFCFQSNFDAPGGEPQAIVARAQLTAIDPRRVELLRERLPSDGYRRLIAESDLVLVPYDRDLYYARSSGIFAEALAAGVPVVVPAGSWMALQLSDDIHTYHRSLLGRRGIEYVDFDGARQRWRSVRGDKGRPLRDGRLDLHGSAARHCRLSVSAESTHLLVSFRDDSPVAGNFVRIAARFLAAQRNQYRGVHAIVGGQCGRVASALFSIPAGAARVRLEFRGAFTDKAIALGDLRFHLLRCPGEVPRSAVGFVYGDPGEIADAVREVIRHRAHYRATAREKSASWAAFHDPSRLVRQLLDSAGDGDIRPLSSLGRDRDFASPREMVA